MEVTLLGHKYNIPEGWVSRWDLLSNYREDTGLTEMEVPAASHITKKQMDKWIELNEKMGRPKYQDKVKLDDISLLVQYFMPVSGKYLRHVNFSSAPLYRRIQLLRELGRWRRDLDVELNRLDLVLFKNDPYIQLKHLVVNLNRDRSATVDTIEIVEGLAEVAKNIPLDFLYGLSDIARGDWRSMPWEDAYSGYDILREEWYASCIAFLRYSDKNHDTLEGMDSKYVGVVTNAISGVPVLNPSNLVRIFTDRELIEPVRAYMSMDNPMVGPIGSMSDKQLRYHLKEYEAERVMPDFFQYQLTAVGIEEIPEGRWVRTDFLGILPEELERKISSLSSEYAEMRAYIPAVDEYYSRLYKYAREHPSWTAFRVIFNGLGLLARLDTQPERSLSSIPTLLNIIDPFTSHDRMDPIRSIVDRINQILGPECLVAMTECIIGATEKESLMDYLNRHMVDELLEVGLESDSLELGRKYTLSFCEYVLDLEVIAAEEGTEAVKWPILKI